MVIDIIAGAAIKTFRHSGARGDMIYSLPTVIARGGGDFKINRRYNHYFATPVDDEEMAGILEFFRTQSYLSSVEEWYGEYLDFDLDAFRAQNVIMNVLTVAHLNSFMAEFDLRKPWIEVDKIPAIPMADIIVARSLKYHDFRFQWKEMIPWKSKAVFIGTEDEYKAFQHDTGLDIKWEMPKTWIEMAGIIRGSKLFIGNQSFPYALAEGMKVPRVLEEFPNCPNCHPQSWNGHVDFSQRVIRKYVMGESYPEMQASPYLEEKMKLGQRRW